MDSQEVGGKYFAHNMQNTKPTAEALFAGIFWAVSVQMVRSAPLLTGSTSCSSGPKAAAGVRNSKNKFESSFARGSA